MPMVAGIERLCRVNIPQHSLSSRMAIISILSRTQIGFIVNDGETKATESTWIERRRDEKKK